MRRGWIDNVDPDWSPRVKGKQAKPLFVRNDDGASTAEAAAPTCVNAGPHQLQSLLGSRLLVVVRGGAVHPVLIEGLIFAGEHGFARLAHKVDQEMQIVNRQ